MTLGQVLQMIREEKGLSRVDVAKAMNDSRVTVDVIRNIENGRTRLQADLIPDICKVFGCTPNYIYSYAYMSEQEYVEHSKEYEDFVSFLHTCDDTVKELSVYLYNIFDGYFKGCIYEEAMVSKMPVEIRKAMHYQSISAFKNAVNDGLIERDYIVDKLMSVCDEYMDMWNHLL